MGLIKLYVESISAFGEEQTYFNYKFWQRTGLAKNGLLNKYIRPIMLKIKSIRLIHLLISPRKQDENHRKQRKNRTHANRHAPAQLCCDG